MAELKIIELSQGGFSTGSVLRQIRGAQCLNAGESMLDEAARFDPEDWCDECGEEITETESDPPRVWVRVCGCGVSHV